MRFLKSFTFLGLISFLGLSSLSLAALDAHRLLSDAPSFGYHDRSRTDSTYYEYTFSSGFDGWYSSDIGAVPSTWHSSATNSFDGSHNWWSADPAIGGYTDHTLLYLELPALDLTEVTAPALYFDFYYAIEDPAGAPAPYDAWDACHVEIREADGEWVLIEPIAPAYNATNAFSFGEIFGQVPTGGWAGMSDGWQQAGFDLSAHLSTATAVRFAIASDDSYSYFDDSSLTGFQVDNIQIVDGAEILLSNNADGVDFPGTTIHYSGAATSGDHWDVSDQYHSPSASVYCNTADQSTVIRNALTSPWMPLPAHNTLAIDFWMRCDLPDFDGNDDGALDDYFSLEYSTDGLVFHELFYEYYGNQTGNGAWYHFIDGAGHGSSTDITALAGLLVQFRFTVVTDDNHDGGTGEGFFLDDFTIKGESFLTQDAGVVEVRLPYPRCVNWPIEAQAKIQNFGSEDFDGVNWTLYMDGLVTETHGSVDLPAAAAATETFTLTPSMPSLHFPELRLMTEDQFADNDRFLVPSFIVREENQIELANDYAWDLAVPEFMHTTGAGETEGLAYAQRFIVPDLYSGSVVYVDSLMLRLASFNIPVGGSVSFDYTLWVGDLETGYGDFVGSAEYTPSFSGGNASADWVTLVPDAPDYTFVVAEGAEFWVVLQTNEMSDEDTPGEMRPVPNVVVVDRSWEAASSAFISSSVQVLDDYQFGFHVFGQAGVDVQESVVRPLSSHLTAVWPNPFNPSTTISFELLEAGDVDLQVYDLMGREVATLVSGAMPAGSHSCVFGASHLASGMYVTRLSVNDQQLDTKKLMLVK
jgi:hypothetical protein